MEKRTGLFSGDDPFDIAKEWLQEAEKSEINDHNAIALATVDSQGLPNARMVLLKDVEASSFVFYTNFNSQKGQEIDSTGKAAFVIHWKSLRRQIRVRGLVEKEQGAMADEYFSSRSLQSRIGAWASPPVRTDRIAKSINERSCQTNRAKRASPRTPTTLGGIPNFAARN